MEVVHDSQRSEEDDKAGYDFFSRLREENIINDGLKKDLFKKYKKPVEWGDEINGRFVKQIIHFDDKLKKQFLEMRERNIL